MRIRDRLLRLSFGRSRLIAAGVSVVLLLSLGAGAFAAAGTTVVPPGGTVAGQGYAYWLQHGWQFWFGQTLPVNPCGTLTANGKRVGYLTLTSVNPGKDKYSCTEPARRPLYVDSLSAECSTFVGDHNGFGTSASQLEQCAKAVFQGAQQTTTIDGQAINTSTLVAATGVYPVHTVSTNNLFSLPVGRGRSAAYGYGLLLIGFSKGTHIIHNVEVLGGTTWNITWTVHTK